MQMKRILTVTVAAAVALTAASAGQAADQRVTVSAPWEVTSVDPSKSGFAFLRMGVMETLIEVDQDGNLKPGLATAWAAENGGLSWRFTLRNGVTFHDGSKFDAAAAASALNRALKKPGILKKAPIAKVEAAGQVVIIKLDKPFAALPALLTHSTTIMTAPASVDATGNFVKAIGTGPFKVARFAPPVGFDTAKFENYWGKKPTIASTKYIATGRAETRALMAESGDADLVFTLDPSGFSRLKSVPSINVVAVPIPRVVTLKVNAGHPFLAAPEARRALSLAIDRKGIAVGITRFPEAAATQLFPPALGAWHDRALPALAYAPDRAKKLLKDLGWSVGADGILERDGKRFSILLRTFPDRPELPLIATALQDQWRAIGVELKVSVSNYSQIPAGHKDGSLHVALYARNYGLTPDPIGTVLADFGADGGDWGAMNWKAPKVAKALEAIAAKAEPSVRKPLITDVAAAIHKDLPLIPIVWYQQTVAISKRLNGIAVDPLERSYGLGRASLSK